jgi:hypothetical protein
MGGAQDIPSIFCQKLIFHPVHRHGNMTTAIDIGKELSIVVDCKALHFSAVDLQKELFGLTWRNLANTRDFDWGDLEHTGLLFPHGLSLL